MGNGPTDMRVLSSFMKFVESSSLGWYMKRVATAIEEIQENLRNISIKEGIQQEVVATNEAQDSDMEYHNGLPKITGYYGKSVDM